MTAQVTQLQRLSVRRTPQRLFFHLSKLNLGGCRSNVCMINFTAAKWTGPLPWKHLIDIHPYLLSKNEKKVVKERVWLITAVRQELLKRKLLWYAYIEANELAPMDWFGIALKVKAFRDARVIKFVKMNVCILMNKCKYYGDLRLNLFFILFSSTYIHHLCPRILHPGFLKSQEPIQEHLLETVTWLTKFNHIYVCCDACWDSLTGKCCSHNQPRKTDNVWLETTNHHAWIAGRWVKAQQLAEAAPKQ